MNILDLPLDKQREFAKLEGMTHEEWVKETKRELAEGDAFLEKVRKMEAEGTSNLTPEERKHFQDKMDSGNPR